MDKEFYKLQRLHPDDMDPISRKIYITHGILLWLEFDGADEFITQPLTGKMSDILNMTSEDYVKYHIGHLLAAAIIDRNRHKYMGVKRSERRAMFRSVVRNCRKRIKSQFRRIREKQNDNFSKRIPLADFNFADFNQD